MRTVIDRNSTMCNYHFPLYQEFYLLDAYQHVITKNAISSFYKITTCNYTLNLLSIMLSIAGRNCSLLKMYCNTIREMKANQIYQQKWKLKGIGLIVYDIVFKQCLWNTKFLIFIIYNPIELRAKIE